jgi:hypothetical protein
MSMAEKAAHRTGFTSNLHNGPIGALAEGWT